MRTFSSPGQLVAATGEELGVSDWHQVTQQQIDQFAAATGDHQWIHTDPLRAAQGPFGATIAHGYLALSLLPFLHSQIYRVEANAVINYGLEQVRFPHPIRCGERIRARPRLECAEERNDTIRLELRAVIEIDGRDKPACVAHTVSQIRF